MADTYGEIGEREIAAAFARIENELLADMVRNLKRHTVEEAASGRQWAQWQALQLESLDRYRRANVRRHGREFDRLNAAVEALVAGRYRSAALAEERAILKAIGGGRRAPRSSSLFLEAPSERLDALLEAVHSDLMKAEHATLRRAQDIYRQTIFDAQVYATGGAGTYAKAIDMATHDFIAKGVNGIWYRNGTHHSIREYSEMCIRTSAKRAQLVAEGDMRRDWGVNTVVVDYRDDACPECMEWVGVVLVDDVYADGTEEEARAGGWHLLSEAMEAGLFHPNCRDTCSTYIPGVSRLAERPSEAAQGRAEAREEQEQEYNAARQKEREYGRLSEMSLDEGNRERYAAKAEEWRERAEAV